MTLFPPVNLPDFEPHFRIKKESDDNSFLIFDPIRRKWVALTPEEWVRQNMISFFIKKRGVPASRISCETTINFLGLKKRCDAIIYDDNLNPLVILEFKAQSVSITQRVFDQISVYNMKLKVPYLFVSNGKRHVFCHVDNEQGKLVYVNRILMYGELL